MVMADGIVEAKELETLYRIGRNCYHLSPEEINKIVVSAGTSFDAPTKLEDRVSILYEMAEIAWADGEIDKRRDEIVFHKGNPISTIIFPKDALERIFDNIVSNAKSHAFTDVNRKNYLLRFSWKIDGTSLVIMIENNGTPIPEDRDTNSLLEYGVSSCLHQNGHNGIGCNEIEDIMSRYNGTVRIISSPKDEYTVKYVLTFNYSNTKNVGLEYGY